MIQFISLLVNHLLSGKDIATDFASGSIDFLSQSTVFPQLINLPSFYSLPEKFSLPIIESYYAQYNDTKQSKNRHFVTTTKSLFLNFLKDQSGQLYKLVTSCPYVQQIRDLYLSNDKAFIKKIYLNALEAAETGQTASLLLAYDFFNLDVNQKIDGTYVIFSAINGGQTEIVSYLIAHQADLSVVDSRQYTPLIAAANDEKFDIVELILHSKGNIDNETDEKGNHLLHLLAESAPNELFKSVLSLSQNNLKNNEGYTPLHVAIRAHQEDKVRILIDGGEDIELRIDDITPLMLATQKNASKIVQLLIQRGADVNALTEENMTALHFADIPEIVQILVQAPNIDINARNYRDDTPLHIALYKENIPTAHALINCGADVNAENVDRISPIIIVIYYNDTYTLNLLISHGANVNAANKYGVAPIHLAAELGRNQIIKILHENGANINAETINHLTPLDLARTNGHKKTIYFLLELGAKGNSNIAIENLIEIKEDLENFSDLIESNYKSLVNHM